MEIRVAELDITLKAERATNFGTWLGSKLRGAIKNGLVYQNCTNMRLGACDICRHTDCPSKFLFDNIDKSTCRIAINPVILDVDFQDTDIVADTISFKVKLLGHAIMAQDKLIDVLKYGIFLGQERVKFQLDTLNELNYTIDITDLAKPESKAPEEISLVLDTPYVVKAKSGITAESFIRNCTTRITGMVNTLGLDYNVEYQKALDSCKDLILRTDVTKQSYKRISTRTHKKQTIGGYTGTLTLKGDLSKVYKYIAIASKLNIGKECTMGFGKFSIIDERREV